MYLDACMQRLSAEAIGVEFSGELWPPMAPENDGLTFLSVLEATLLFEHFMDSGIGRCG